MYLSLTRLKCNLLSVLLGDISFRFRNGYSVYRRKEWNMFVVVVSILLLLFVALSGADLLVSNINSDELSNMGVEKKS